MILLLIIVLLPFSIHAGHSATMHEENAFEDTATLVMLFNSARRGEGGEKELSVLAGQIPLATLEVMQRACDYAVRERQKVLLDNENREAQSLLELRALECYLRNRHYNWQLVAQQNQTKRIENSMSIGMSVAGLGTGLTTVASYLCCGVITMQTVVGSAMIGAGCGCLCCVGAIDDSLCGKHNQTPIERDLANDLERARALVLTKEAVQQAEDRELKKQWKESLHAKKME